MVAALVKVKIHEAKIINRQKVISCHPVRIIEIGAFLTCMLCFLEQVVGTDVFYSTHPVQCCDAQSAGDISFSGTGTACHQEIIRFINPVTSCQEINDMCGV